MMYPLLAVIGLLTLALGTLFPSVPWYIWLILLIITVPTAIWGGPPFILWLRGFRNEKLSSEVSILSGLRRSYRVAFSPRAHVEYVEALTRLPYYAVWEVEAVPEYRAWLGTNAVTVFELVSFHGTVGRELETLDRLMESGITDFERLRAYADELGLDVALLALGEDMPLEYARAVYTA